jgi:Arc/MetJ-type ribon-helix-helix transcriptional regulator
MVTLPVTLPEDVVIFVEAQVAARRLAGPSEYLQALIAGAQKEQEQAELEVRFAEAIRAVERGDPNPLSPNDWERLRRRVLSQAQPPVARS